MYQLLSFDIGFEVKMINCLQQFLWCYCFGICFWINMKQSCVLQQPLRSCCLNLFLGLLSIFRTVLERIKQYLCFKTVSKSFTEKQSFKLFWEIRLFLRIEGFEYKPMLKPWFGLVIMNRFTLTYMTEVCLWMNYFIWINWRI